MTRSVVNLSNGNQIVIIHDLPMKGNVNTFNAAMECWITRTNKYTAQSLVDYINSKGVHFAITEEKFNKVKSEHEASKGGKTQ